MWAKCVVWGKVSWGLGGGVDYVLVGWRLEVGSWKLGVRYG